MRRRGNAVALAAIVLSTAPVARAQDACDLNIDCGVQRAEDVQPCPFDTRVTIDRAANAALGVEGPELPRVRSGCVGGAMVAGRVPCQLLRAFAYARTGWRQFCTDGCGAGNRGPTRLSAVCGIGLMGLPASGLPEGVDLARVVSKQGYNAGAGAVRLARAWNATPCVGNRDPEVAEHWYFAVWSADEFTYANNPNNPAYPVLRGAYGSPSGFDRSSYPFQEIVFGLAGEPPRGDDGAPLWDPSPVNLPGTSEICGTAACVPANVPSPLDTHDRDCQPFVPPIDAGPGDAGPDAGPDDGGVDAGNIVPEPREPGCGCRVVGTRGSDLGLSLALLSCAVVATRRRRR